MDRVISEAAFYGGAKDQTTGSAVTLNFNLYRVHTVSTTSAGLNIKLQSARQLKTGGVVGFVVNAGSNSFNLVDNSNNVLKVMAAGDAVVLGLLDNTTAAGSWILREGTANFVEDPPVNLFFYLLGGEPSTTYDQAQREYDSQIETWTRKTDIPDNGDFQQGASAVYGTVGYYLHQDNGGSGADHMVSYDPDVWTLLSASDDVNWSGCGMVVIGTSIACFDGLGGTGFRTREYVVGGDSWTTRATRTSGHGVNYVMCALANSKAVLPGGTSNACDTYSFDTWTAKTTRPGADVFRCSTTVKSNVCYLYGGLTSTGGLFVADVKTYDESTDTWSSLASMSIGRADAASCSIGSLNYVAAGFSGTAGSAGGSTSNKTDSNWEHSVSVDTYLTKPVVPFVSSGPPAGLYNVQNQGAAITP